MTNQTETIPPALEPDLEARILSAAQAGTLLDLMVEHFGLKGIKPFQDAAAGCASLHNSGHIDLMALGSSAALAALDPHDFFTVQQVYLECIPWMDASVAQMIQLTDALVRQGGEDLMSNQPNDAFLIWLRRDPSRAEGVIDLAEAGDTTALSNLTFALQALGDIPRAQTLAGETEGLPRLSGLTALSRLPHTSSEATDTRALAVRLISCETDDGVLCHALDALIQSEASVSTTESIEVAAEVRAALAVGGPHTQMGFARALWNHAARLSPETRDALLDGLAVINPDHGRIVQTFDVGLSALFGSSPELAIAACKRFLSDPRNEGHKLLAFPSFSSALLGSPLFGATALDWLGDGGFALCDGIHDLLAKRDRDSEPLILPPPTFDDETAVFACCKAVGFFFLQPVIAASVLVAVLRQPERDCTNVIEDLLFDAILVNYSGPTRDYLDAIAAEDPAYPSVQKAVAQADAYLEGLKSVGDIPELRPSERQRQIERTRSADMMRKAMEEGQKESVFYNLFTRSTVLHGRRTLSYFQDSGGPLRAFDMELQSHGVSYELPRMEIIDPLGLERMLGRFRSLTREPS